MWTPTILIANSKGEEKHRIEGFLPADDFLAQLELGLARLELEMEHFREAEDHFTKVCDGHPASASAPEGCYWAGVARYKASKKPEDLVETGRTLQKRYPASEWARKASVWLPS